MARVKRGVHAKKKHKAILKKAKGYFGDRRSEEHTSELQSH